MAAVCERNVTAGSYGYLVTQDEAGLALDRKLTPRWSTYGGLRGFRSEDIGAGPIQESRVYARRNRFCVGHHPDLARAVRTVVHACSPDLPESPLANG